MSILGSLESVLLLLIIELFSLDVIRLRRYRAKIDRKSAISFQRGEFDPNFQV